MNGLPDLKVMRSVSLYGLSTCALTFADGTDNYFARQQVFERLPDVELPDGVTPVDGAALLAVGTRLPLRARRAPIARRWSSRSSRTGCSSKAYQVGARRRRHVVARRRDDAVPGAARSDASSRAPDSRSPTSATALGANNGNAGGGFYSEGGQFYYVRGLGRVATLEDIGNIVARGAQRHAGAREGRRPGGDRHAPRLGQFGFNEQNDAVEGIILMRTGEQAQTVLKRVEAKTRELNDTILPKDVKVVPFYDRSDLDRAHDAHGARTTCCAASCSSSSC